MSDGFGIILIFREIVPHLFREEELSTVESKSFSVKEEAEEMSLTEVESGVSSSNSGFVSQGPSMRW